MFLYHNSISLAYVGTWPKSTNPDSYRDKADFSFLEIYAFSHTRTAQTATLFGRIPDPTVKKAGFLAETKIGRSGRQIIQGIIEIEQLSSKLFPVQQAINHQHYFFTPREMSLIREKSYPR